MECKKWEQPNCYSQRQTTKTTKHESKRIFKFVPPNGFKPLTPTFKVVLYQTELKGKGR